MGQEVHTDFTSRNQVGCVAAAIRVGLGMDVPVPGRWAGGGKRQGISCSESYSGPQASLSRSITHAWAGLQSSGWIAVRSAAARLQPTPPNRWPLPNRSPGSWRHACGEFADSDPAPAHPLPPSTPSRSPTHVPFPARPSGPNLIPIHSSLTTVLSRPVLAHSAVQGCPTAHLPTTSHDMGAERRGR